MTLVHRRKVKLLGVISFGARKTTACDQPSIHLIPLVLGCLKVQPKKITGCGLPDYPGVYAKVSNPDILKWVQGFMEKCSYESVFACGTISEELTEMGKETVIAL